MSGAGEYIPAFQAAGAHVNPKEIDRYEVYTIIGPMMGTFSWGTAVGTSTQTPTFTFDQAIADYPRSVTVKLNTASGSTGGGTLTVFGFNQFGESQSESFAIAVAANGGTTNGTKVWASFSSASAALATMNAGNGTFTLSPTDAGTTALFGLPTKIGGSTDVKMMTFGSTGVAKPVNGGTLGAFVDIVNHAIKAPNTITTPAANTTWIQVWFKPTWDNLFKRRLTGLSAK